MGSSRVAGLIRDGESGATRARGLTAQLRTAPASYAVRIRDLSALGARIEAERLPSPGMIVCLQRGGAAVFGVMAWVEDGQGGILFDEELDTQIFGAEPQGAERLARAASAGEIWARLR
ncbi:hypothetical protein [Sphingosinicella sp. YJ22]|uniref:hypothetical protein n=1 Tax=Sphingosinicella sp. YJ22 TaxID=1104780 RepID=UPI001407CD2C|nr:hypothetical protein [Sphingosinicella sp. YJ22]